MDIHHKTAIITGAGKGIGKAIAEALAKEGVQLGLLARTASDLEQLKTELTSTYDIQVFTATSDIGNSEEARQAVASLAASLGRVDILINNAGIGSFGKMVDMDPAEWEQILRVNLMGTYYVTHELLPGMIAQESGDIINIASTAGERGFATGSAYCASKFAVLGMTESLMQEVRKFNIRVTALTPSTVNTPLAVNAGLPIGEEDRMMQPEDLAELVVAALKLPSRVLLKSAGLWTNNPQ